MLKKVIGFSFDRTYSFVRMQLEETPMDVVKFFDKVEDAKAFIRQIDRDRLFDHIET